ncbi:MAG: SCP2 sterol-binding domain-containing protein, partial [Deltaproteobacteria bacterium]|nr:SCP2 sterol-binding domain-containing protein [Deltaproteobacteria bacterium]
KPELQKELNEVIVFDITGPVGGKWTLDMNKGADWVKPGAEGVTPKMTLVCSDKDFVAVCTKKMNANMAAVSGKLKFKPMDMNLALKLGKLIG